MSAVRLFALVTSLAIAGCSADPDERGAPAAAVRFDDGIAVSADAIRPRLLGTPLPEANVRTLDGDELALAQAIGDRPAVLVFYRGGWCPYCSLQLSDLRLIRDDLDALGYRLIAISPDSTESLRATMDKTPLDYTLLSDSRLEAGKAFGLAYRLDEATLERYVDYGIDLAGASGETHGALPVPAVYIVDADGTLQFSYVHPDYTVRVPGDVILAAARAIHEERQKLERRRKSS